MLVGYIRISTVGQNTARQEVLMQELGVEKIFIDRMSGKNTDRPQLKEMLTFVRSGDTVVVESISRFARNTVDSLTTVRKLKERGVEVFFEKERPFFESSLVTIKARSFVTELLPIALLAFKLILYLPGYLGTQVCSLLPSVIMVF